MDSTAQRAHVGYKIINKNRVAVESEIITETASTGDAWILQRKEPMWALKSSTKTESPQNKKSSTKRLPRVRHGFDSANSHTASEIFNKTASTVDEWIRQRKQPLRLQKYSTELLPLVTHGFDSANSPCGTRNLQRNCFHS